MNQQPQLSKPSALNINPISTQMQISFNIARSVSNRYHSPNRPARFTRNNVNVKFSKAQRLTLFDRSSDLIPGPGQYDSFIQSVKSKSVKSLHASKTLSQRFINKQKNFPGPGSYDSKFLSFKSSPKFSIFQRTKSSSQLEKDKNNNKPSPATYQVNNKQKFYEAISSQITIPKAVRFRKHQQKFPGPGKYLNEETSFSSQKSFGKRSFSSQKREIRFDSKTYSPGPSQYNPQSEFQKSVRQKKGFTQRGLSRSVSQKFNLGPGQYNPVKPFKNNTISHRFSRSKSSFLTYNNNQSNLEPGKYDKAPELYNKFKFKSIPTHKFSKDKLESLKPLKTQSPDKFYDIKDKLTKKSALFYSLSNSNLKGVFQEKHQKSPVSTKYNPDDSFIRNKNPTYKFSKSKRPQIILNKLKVDPGTYNPSRSSLTKMGIKFSKEKRQLKLQGLKLSAIYKISAIKKNAV